MSSLRVRRMLERDIEHVVEIERAAFAGDEGSTALSESDLRMELSKQWARLWVVEDGVPIGFFLAWHVVDELHVHNVAVHPSHRRRGVARRLLQAAREYIDEHAIERALLEVREGNVAARALYEGEGYAITGERKGYYADGESAIEMMWLRERSG